MNRWLNSCPEGWSRIQVFSVRCLCPAVFCFPLLIWYAVHDGNSPKTYQPLKLGAPYSHNFRLLGAWHSSLTSLRRYCHSWGFTKSEMAQWGRRTSSWGGRKELIWGCCEMKILFGVRKFQCNPSQKLEYVHQLVAHLYAWTSAQVAPKEPTASVFV